MKRNTNKIKRLKNEIDFLNKGIDSREEAFDTIYKEKQKQMAITKQLTYLFIIIDSLDKLTNNDNSSMSRVIKKALNTTKAELGEGMLSLPHFNINKIINDSTDEE